MLLCGSLKGSAYDRLPRPLAAAARRWTSVPWQDVVMRFRADGPAIPDILLEERDAGNVVFLCGAGVSIPAGLPGFVDLTRHVIDAVDPSQDSEVRLAFGPWIYKNATVPARPLDQIFQLLHREYGREQVAKIVWKRLASNESPRSRAHDVITRISADSEGQPQIVTTNFDRLFESALGERAKLMYRPPMYPDLRHGVPATGITYLHGRLADAESDAHDYILSSADLGRAYLAEGWATVFIRQLLQRHTVVLLGYRAEDPPVQYLFQGLDSTGRQTTDRLFAFDEGSRDDVEGRWRGPWRASDPLRRQPRGTVGDAGGLGRPCGQPDGLEKCRRGNEREWTEGVGVAPKRNGGASRPDLNRRQAVR